MNGFSAGLDELKSKEAELIEIWQPVEDRMKEHVRRPKAVAELDQNINKLRARIASSKDSLDKYLKEETVQVLFKDYSPIERVAKAEKFLKDANAKQAEKQDWEVPAFRAEEVETWIEKMQSESTTYEARLAMAERIHTSAQQKKAQEEAKKAVEEHSRSIEAENTASSTIQEPQETNTEVVQDEIRTDL